MKYYTSPNIYIVIFYLIGICILIYINPIEQIMLLIPRYTFYYSENQVKVTNYPSFRKENTNLYDSTLTNILGSALYNVFSLKTNTGTFDIEYVTFSLSSNDSINFTTSTFSDNSTVGFLKSGTFTYSITGGSGKFVGSKGYIKFNIKNGLRKIDIYIA